MSTAQAEYFAMPLAMQPQYNLLERGIEAEALPCCLENNISLTPWSPLGGGWLTGKYSAANRPSGATRLGEDPNQGVKAYDIRNTDLTYRILDVVETRCRVNVWLQGIITPSRRGQMDTWSGFHIHLR